MKIFKRVINCTSESQALKVILTFSAFTLFELYFCLNIFSQSFTLYGDKTFGGSQTERSATIYSKPNSVVLSGVSNTIADGDKSDSLCISTGPYNDQWIVEINTDFNILFQKDLGGNLYEFSSNIIETLNDNQYMVTSSSASGVSCEKSDSSRGSSDYWICMMDTSGSLQWQKTFGSSSGDNFPKSIQTSDQNIWIGGVSISGISGDKTVSNFGDDDYWIVKTDPLGNKIWDKVFGSSGRETASYDGWDFIPFDSTGILLVGNSTGPNDGLITDTCRGFFDIWAVCIDSAGNKIWDNRFGGTTRDLPSMVKNADNSNFIICGFTESIQSGEVSEPGLGDYDYWVVKIDNNGNKIWDHRYGGSGDDKAFWIEKADNGGYWIAGFTTSGMGGHVSEPAYGTKDYWIIKIDSVGNKLWDKRFGGPGENYLTSAVILADSSIMLFGTADSGTTAIKTDPGKGDTDYWLVHFKYTDSTTSINEIKDTTEFSLFPNPSNGLITIPENLFGSKLSIHDISGRLLYHRELKHDSQIDLTQLSDGFYTLTFMHNGIHYKTNWIKQH